MLAVQVLEYLVVSGCHPLDEFEDDPPALLGHIISHAPECVTGTEPTEAAALEARSRPGR